MRKVFRLSMLVIAVVAATALVLTAAQAQRSPAPPTSAPHAAPVDPAITAFMKPIEVADGENDLVRKQKERHNAAVRLLELRVQEYRKGITPLSPVFESARLVGEAKMDLASSDEDRAAVFQQSADVSRVVEDTLEKQVKAGFGSEVDLARARLARLTAEVELLKLKQPKQSGNANNK